MSIFVVVLLALVQGAAELLPVSSSAHVILVERLLGLDPAAPEMTFLLVMLHTGTMLAVLARYWPRWSELLRERSGFLTNVVIATGITGVLGLGLKTFIEKVVLRGEPKAEIEELFRNLPLMAAALAAAGVLILIAGRAPTAENDAGATPLSRGRAAIVGLVQGLCLPFRGFSRSGATISTALLLRERRERAENFSFALAVAVTPPVIALEVHRLMKAHATIDPQAIKAGLLGLSVSFLAGLVALKLLAAALEKGRWKLFGYYCLGFAAVVVGVSLWCVDAPRASVTPEAKHGEVRTTAPAATATH